VSSQLIKQIVTLIQENHFDEAQGVISRVAAVQASNPSVLLEVGKLSLLMGNLEPAEKYLRASLALNQGDADTHYQLGLVLLKKGQLDLAMPIFREACELRTDFALGHFYWGLTLYQMGNLKGALGQFKLAIKLDSSLFLSLYYSGLASKALSQTVESKQYFDQVINVEPSFAPAHNELGVYNYELGQESEAVISFQRACKLRPDFATAHLNLANVFAKMGKNETAQMHYNEALKNPDLSAFERASAYNNLAVIHAKAKHWESASESLLQAQEITPSVVLTQTNFGLVLIALHEYDLAANKFEQIIRDNPANLEALFYSGLSLLCLGKYDDALKNLIRSAQPPDGINAKTSPLYQQILLWLAYGYLANHKYEEATIELKKLTALDHRKSREMQSLAFDAMGVCCALQGKHDEAKHHFNKSLEIDDKLAIAYLHRARSSEVLKLKESASKDYAQALKLDPDCLRADKDYIGQLLDSAQKGQALNLAFKIVGTNPGDFESKLLLARAFQQESNYSEALAILTDIIKKEPNNVAAQTILGQIYMAQGDFAQADEIFRSASKMKNVDAELFLSWARALAYLGFHELALEKFKEAADMNPYDSNIYESWAQALKSLGRFNEASEVYKLASSYL